FTVSDQRLSDTENLQITVEHVNRPPKIAPIAGQSVSENETLTFEVVGSDPDIEDEGKWRLTTKDLPQGARFDSTSGMFTWTPTFEQSGTYTVTFINTDPNGLSARQQVEINVKHVNRTPVFEPIARQSVDENQWLRLSIPPATDPDVEDEGKLTYKVENLPEGAEFDADSLKLNWKPTYQQAGKYQIIVAVSDGEFTVEKPLEISVNHVNRSPQLQTVDDKTVDENSSLIVKPQFSDPDQEDEGRLSVSATGLPEGARFDETEAELTWTPDYEQSGTYNNIMFVVKDENGLKDSSAFTITVNHVNRPPALETIEYIVGEENSPVTLTLNASDPDSEDVGKLIFEANNLPQGADFNAQSGTFSWTPNFLQAGTYQIDFKVLDSQNLSDEQSAQITITDVNRTPELMPVEKQIIPENQRLSFELQGDDPDTDNQLSFSAGPLPEGAEFDTVNHVFSWKPTFEQAGAYTVRFSLTDGMITVSQTVDIEVQNVNRAPQFSNLMTQTVNENESFQFKVQAEDADANSQLSISAVKLPEGAVFDPSNNQLTWKPTFAQAGSYEATFRASDGEDQTEGTLQIVVKNVNRPPQFTENIQPLSVNENETVTFTVQATDEDEDTELKYRADNLPQGADFSGEDGRFSWTPNYGQAGDYVINVIVSDGETETTMQVDIVVENVNRPPSIDGPDEAEIEAGQSLNLQYTAEDPDDDELTFTGENLPAGADLNSSGKFSWEPDDDQTGNRSFTIRVSDGNEEDTMQTTVNVKDRPQPAPEPVESDTTGN
ncbi:MAG: tandem-95 repeat protein, partial [Caldithrix sp.]|nr:tandem-95 repeat protein [Caldithrix sp.]